MDIPTQDKKHLNDAQPKETWFIERTGDGFIFACNEVETWEILNNPSSWRRRDFRILGVSDGKTYSATIRNAKGDIAELETRRKELENTIAKYRKTEEKFIFEDVLDDDDPRVKRVREKLTELEVQLEPVEKELKLKRTKITQIAFNAELEIARGNIKRPRGSNIITPGGDRADVLKQMKVK